MIEIVSPVYEYMEQLIVLLALHSRSAVEPSYDFCVREMLYSTYLETTSIRLDIPTILKIYVCVLMIDIK